MREIKRRYLEESKCEIIKFLLLAESDQQLLTELRVEEDLLLLEGELLLPSLAQHGVAQGGDVVADVVNTSLLLCIKYFLKREYFYINFNNFNFTWRGIGSSSNGFPLSYMVTGWGLVWSNQIIWSGNSCSNKYNLFTSSAQEVCITLSQSCLSHYNHSAPLLTRRQNLALNSSMSSKLLCSSHWFSNVNSASITKLELSKLGSLIICWYSSIIWSASRSFTWEQSENT